MFKLINTRHSFHSGQNMYTVHSTNLNCPQKFFCAFLEVPHYNTYTCQYYVYFFSITRFCETLSAWLQLLLAVSRIIRHRVTTKIWLTSPWVKRTGRRIIAFRLTKIHQKVLFAMWAFAITWCLSSVNFSDLNLLLWNRLAKWTETW